MSAKLTDLEHALLRCRQFTDEKLGEVFRKLRDEGLIDSRLVTTNAGLDAIASHQAALAEEERRDARLETVEQCVAILKGSGGNAYVALYRLKKHLEQGSGAT